MRRIDFHAHLWARPDAEEAILASARRHSVDLVCLSAIGSYTPDHEEIVQLNARTERAIRTWPETYIGFVYVNPLHGEQALEDIDRAVAGALALPCPSGRGQGEGRAAGMRGIKLWVSCLADDPAVHPIAERAIELGWPILQHAWHKWTGNLPGESDPTDVAKLAQRFPDLKLVMAHVGGDWEYGLKAVRRCENVWVDTSGSIADSGMIETCVNELGAERVVWGTDMPGADLLYTLAKIEGAAIPDSAKERILGGNAAGLLGL